MPYRHQQHVGSSWGRRDFLLGSAALVAWPLLSPPLSATVRKNVALKSHPFQLGVASGDPTADGFVIWTRLAPEPLDGGGMPHENIEVRWQVARDEKMTQVVASGTSVATPELAHSVHVEVAGLEPQRWYFYQFQAVGETSSVGRARTMPAADALPDRLRFAFASCQHYEHGLFTAYAHMMRSELDLIVHLGDYIYEGAAKDNLVRKHVGLECETLEGYRTRHAQYKTDEYLQGAHAACPWIVTWDDHEFDNNCASDISEQTGVEPGPFLERRARAYQAYYEHMPLRRAQIPRGPHMQLYRHVDCGRLARFAVLDTRQYRSDQPCGDNNKPPCDETYSPQATLLGDAQEQWLTKTLDATPAQWNVLAQQVMMARADRLMGEGVAYSMDQWPGYEVNRQRVLKYFAARPKLNPIVLTGDIHTHWANNLQVNSADPQDKVVASEFVGTSISSGGNGTLPGEKPSPVLSENPFVKYHSTQRGYISCEVTPRTWRSHYHTLDYVTRPGAPLQTPVKFAVESGQPGLQKI